MNQTTREQKRIREVEKSDGDTSVRETIDNDDEGFFWV